MKTYLNDQVKGMSQMNDMKDISQMMEMQSMYEMIQSMYCMIKDMHDMMSMHGIDPMMNMHGMYPMIDMQDDMRQFPIPMLVNLVQLSANQIQISYDRDVDMRLGMKPTNYWIQDTKNTMPLGIATLGRNDKVNARNSLTNNMVRITPMNGSAKTFILTFNRIIPKGAEYRLIICYVTVKGAPPYNGDNGKFTFVGK